MSPARTIRGVIGVDFVVIAVVVVDDFALIVVRTILLTHRRNLDRGHLTGCNHSTAVEE